MTLFSRLMYAPDAATGLCATCSWGTVRKGFRPAEAETFCRLVGPGLVCCTRCVSAPITATAASR